MCSYVDDEQIDHIIRMNSEEIDLLVKSLRSKPSYNCGIYHNIVIGGDNMWRRTIVLIKPDTIILDNMRKIDFCLRFPYQEYELVYKDNSIRAENCKFYRRIKDIITYQIPEESKTIPDLWAELPDMCLEEYSKFVE